MSAKTSASRRDFIKGASLAGLAPLALGASKMPTLTVKQPFSSGSGGGHQDINEASRRPPLLDPDNVPLNPTSSVVINNAGINFGQFRIAGDNNPNLFVLDSATDCIGIGTSTPAYPLDVVMNLAQTSGEFIAFHSYVQLNPAGASTARGRPILAEIETSATNTQNINAILIGNQTRFFHRGSGTISEARGLNMVSRNVGSGTISIAQGAQFLVQNDSTGTITNCYAQYNNIGNVGTGTIGTAMCFFGDNAVNNGTIVTSYGLYLAKLRGQTNYGIYIMSQDLGTTANYAIYSEGGASVLKAGSPSVVPLTIQGATSQTANLQEWRSASGALMAWLSATGLLDVQGISIQSYTATVGSPPTKAQLDSIFGSPATLGSGFIGMVDSGGAQTDVYLCVTTPANWFYIKLNKAL